MSNENKSLALPPAPERPPVRVERAGYGYYNAQPIPEEGESSEAQTPLSHYLWILRRRKWPLLIFVVFAVAATIIVSSRLTPYYESTATLDVDRMVPTAVIGQESATRAVSANDSDTFLATQMKLIQSDSVLRPVAEQLKIPLPKARPDATVTLPYLSIARPTKTYLLTISYRNPDPAFAARVANAIADSFIRHSRTIRYKSAIDTSNFMAKQLEDLQAKMERSSAALAQYQKVLNVVSPDEKTNIQSARLLQLNTEYTNAQAERVKKEVAASSAASGSIEAIEASDQGEQLRKLSDKIDEANQKFAEVKTHYGANNVEYKRSANTLSELQRQFDALKANITQRIDVEYREAANREATLLKTRDEAKAELDGLDGKAIEYANLKRDADADRKLYEDLNRRIQEAEINAGFQDSSIRLADPGRPAARPVFPRIRTNGLIAFFASALLGIIVVFISDSMDHTLRDPEQIARQLQTEVLGSLPVVKAWRGHLPGKGADTPQPRELFGLSKGLASSYEEAIRTLRDSILLPNADRRPRTLLMTSATPREGKSTTAVHLAVVHSQQKRKTLLIDADLRRPSIYQYLGVSNDRGLSNVVNGDVEWHDALQTSEALPYLTVLPAGPASRRAADGLGTTLKELFATAMKEYDLIICDAPPLLGFAESLQIAKLVDGVVVVALAGQTERNAVSSVLTNLRRLNANVMGLALNEVRADMSERYYYYGYYGKYYSRYYKPLKD
ncbi:MAG TPA: polysaccharide biosynthesis tyrosine autokinase [Bryobacteraceae bacterium]|nr:polysaccharide biosynthesis tyrosine autokinase [Bryobacteraceae bacterium]